MFHMHVFHMHVIILTYMRLRLQGHSMSTVAPGLCTRDMVGPVVRGQDKS